MNLPLQGEQDTDISGNEKHWSDVIELIESLFNGFVCRQMTRVLQNNNDADYRDRTEGEINVETPSPGDSIRKHPTKYRTHEICNLLSAKERMIGLPRIS